jgi:hypothetical protein
MTQSRALEGLVVADALIGAFAREYRPEGPGEAELPNGIRCEVSPDPLKNLVAAKAVPAREALRAGLTILCPANSRPRTRSASSWNDQ